MGRNYDKIQLDYLENQVQELQRENQTLRVELMEAKKEVETLKQEMKNG